PRGEHLPEGAPRERLEGVPARDRRAAARLARSARRLRGRAGRGLERAEGDRLPRLLHQPLQPAAGRAARRWADRRRNPSRAVGARARRPARSGAVPAERDSRLDPRLRGYGALAALEDPPVRRLRFVLLGAPMAAPDRRVLLLRPGSAARRRHPRHARPAPLLGWRTESS